jgi:hypothetical protein
MVDNAWIRADEELSPERVRIIEAAIEHNRCQEFIREEIHREAERLRRWNIKRDFADVGKIQSRTLSENGTLSFAKEPVSGNFGK